MGSAPGCGFRVTCILISETLRRRDSRDGNALLHEGSQECVIFQEHDRSPLQRGKGTKTHGACWEAVAAMPARADGACPGGGRRRRCDSGVVSVGPVHGLDAEEERVKNQDEC